MAPRPESEEMILALHREAIIIDAQNASLDTIEYLEKFRHAGITAIRKNVGPYFYTLRQSLSEVGNWYSMIRDHDTLMLVSEADDIRKAKKSGKLGIILGTNSTKLFDDDVKMVEVFHKLGVNVVQFTYNHRTSLGDGCAEKTNSGLSELGRQMVDELNRNRILIDLSHVGYATSLDVITQSKDPVTFTHSNPRALCDNPRNIPDELIRACAEKGGVVGVVAYPAFVTKKSLEPTPEDLLNHIDYLVKAVGVNHVGFGLDITEGQPRELFEPLIRAAPNVYPPWPWHFAISSASEFKSLTAGLVRRGYSKAEMLKIVGGNFLSLFQRVWR